MVRDKALEDRARLTKEVEALQGQLRRTPTVSGDIEKEREEWLEKEKGLIDAHNRVSKDHAQLVAEIEVLKAAEMEVEALRAKLHELEIERREWEAQENALTTARDEAMQRYQSLEPLLGALEDRMEGVKAEWDDDGCADAEALETHHGGGKDNSVSSTEIKSSKDADYSEQQETEAEIAGLKAKLREAKMHLTLTLTLTLIEG